jgi:N-acetylglucosaminyldiphosphoundecaprenol N-acetyl-beta-D-mannosaminyltransferase
VPFGIRHFYYGGKEGIAGELKRRMEARFPGLIVSGTYTPPFRPLNAAEEADLAAMVGDAAPHFFWVGLSTPKQERFMDANFHRLGAGIMLGVGAAFDMHAGRIPQAPRWMQRSGLEWLFRLCSEPRRLWKRYLVNNPLFLVRIAAQFAKLKHYQLS